MVVFFSPPRQAASSCKSRCQPVYMYLPLSHTPSANFVCELLYKTRNGVCYVVISRNGDSAVILKCSFVAQLLMHLDHQTWYGKWFGKSMEFGCHMCVKPGMCLICQVFCVVWQPPPEGITDISEFKSRRGLFPEVKPFVAIPPATD